MTEESQPIELETPSTFEGVCFSKECGKTRQTSNYIGESPIPLKKGPNAGKPKPNCFLLQGECQTCGKKTSKVKSMKKT